MFTVRRPLTFVLSTVAALVLLLSSLGPAPSAAADTGTGYNGHLIKVSPHLALAKGLSTTHLPCQDTPLDDANDPRCYIPQQIQTAYNFAPLLSHGLDGRGETIVIVDAYSNPDIQLDLQMFDQDFDLPDPDFQVIAPFGLTPFDITNDNQVSWAGEISIDVQMAHAIAPRAKIILALAKTNDDRDLLQTTRYVVEHNLGDVISQSWGEAETCMDARLLAAQHLVFMGATLRHITLVASSGDWGAAMFTCDGSGFFRSVPTPAGDPFVLAVGGTNLDADANGNYVGERAWADPFSGCWPTDQFGCSGGGFSTLFQRPFYQAGVAHITGTHRALPDVAYNAGFDGGPLFLCAVAVKAFYGLEPNSSYLFTAAGTSFGSPQWASLTAIADQAAGHRLGWLNPTIYRLAANAKLYAAAFHDITTGNNNYADVPGYQSQNGWDAVTGWGTPNAAVLVPLLNKLHDDHDDARGDQ